MKLGGGGGGGRGGEGGAYDGPAPHWEEAATHLTVSGYRTDRNRD